MTEPPYIMKRIAEQLGPALASADLSAFSELLDPDVHWGPPGDSSPPCRNRNEVLAWYRRGKDAGTRAEILEILAVGDHILVGMSVTSTKEPSPIGRVRWQVLTVADGRVVAIAGFEGRDDATHYIEA